MKCFKIVTQKRHVEEIIMQLEFDGTGYFWPQKPFFLESITAIYIYGVFQSIDTKRLTYTVPHYVKYFSIRIDLSEIEEISIIQSEDLFNEQ